MLSPRWKKILGDLRSNPSRTLLVVLSIFIGVFAVGLITSSQAIIVREMREGYLQAHPSHATISVSDEDSFEDELLQTIENMDEVGVAEGRRTYRASVRTSQGDWRDLNLVAIDDFDEIQIDQFTLLQGITPPPDKELLIERSGLVEVGAQIGDTLLIERPDGKQRQMRIAGVVYAPTEFPAQFVGPTAYVNFETIEWMSGERDFNEVRILAAQAGADQAHNEAVATAVYDKMRKSGRDPAFPLVPVPGEHPLEQFIQGMISIMGMLGVMSVFLSGFLVTNTISALLAQQIRQIGIMKSIGARLSHIVGMYLVLVLIFGLIALALAYPLVQLATRAFTTVVATLFNLEITSFDVPTYVVLLQVAISLLVPVLAALYPILAGTRITIRDALGSDSGPGGYGTGLIDRLIKQVRGLPRPILLSLRNTFRRKGRVALTLITLTLGGAIFISIFSARNSLMLTLDDILSALFNYDVAVDFDRDYRDEFVISLARQVEGVVDAETWRQAVVRRILPGDRESESITLWAVPPTSEMVRPTVIEGRWLLPTDENAIVLSNGIFQDEGDIAIGDEIILRIKGRDSPWRVVGQVVTIGGERWAYVGYEIYGRVAREVGASGSLQISTTRHDLAYQEAVAAALDEHLTRRGVEVISTTTTSRLRAQNETFFNVIIFGLLIMSLLIAVVGGLGLAGTMSLNVLERTREIGVMRAIGASDNAVLQVVMVEGIVLGSLSWLLGAALSFPLSRLFSEQVGLQLFSFPLTFSFSMQGALIWLVISLVLAAVASFLPAWRASRVTVRDVLAYE